MNTDECCQNSPDDFQAERARLFTEIAELKEQRADLIKQLAECHQKNQRLRAELGRDS